LRFGFVKTRELLVDRDSVYIVPRSLRYVLAEAARTSVEMTKGRLIRRPGSKPPTNDCLGRASVENYTLSRQGRRVQTRKASGPTGGPELQLSWLTPRMVLSWDTGKSACATRTADGVWRRVRRLGGAFRRECRSNRFCRWRGGVFRRWGVVRRCAGELLFR
jgi:hypothetical protein